MPRRRSCSRAAAICPSVCPIRLSPERRRSTCSMSLSKAVLMTKRAKTSACATPYSWVTVTRKAARLWLRTPVASGSTGPRAPSRTALQSSNLRTSRAISTRRCRATTRRARCTRGMERGVARRHGPGAGRHCSKTRLASQGAAFRIPPKPAERLPPSAPGCPSLLSPSRRRRPVGAGPRRGATRCRPVPAEHPPHSTSATTATRVRPGCPRQGASR